MPPWREHHYPKLLSDRREANGIDRCKSAGAPRVHELTSLVNGNRVVDPVSRTPLSTPGFREPGVWIFAVKDGRLRLAPDGGSRSRGFVPPADAIKHETLFENASVNAAGELIIAAGKIREVSNDSGTYNCLMDDHFRGATLEALRSAGLSDTPEFKESAK